MSVTSDLGYRPDLVFYFRFFATVFLAAVFFFAAFRACPADFSAA